MSLPTKPLPLRGGWLLVLATVPGAVFAQAPPPQAKLMINVRERPDLGSVIVGVLNKGEPAVVLRQEGEFVRLRTPGGTEGYLKHKYLAHYAGPQPATVPVAATPAAPAMLPVEAYRSPYPAEPLVGTRPRAPAPGGPPPPMTFLSADRRSGVQFTVGVGALLSTQDREGLRRELAQEGYGGQVDKLDRAAPAGFLRIGYGLSAPWQLEVALSYIDDLDLRLSSAALTPTTLAQSVADHAPASGFGLAPTLAYRWSWPGSALSLRAGGHFSLGNETEVRLNGRPLDVEYRTHGWLAGLSWEAAGPSGLWQGLDLQLLHVNELAGLVTLSLRWGQ
ncbi:SH3 domain-containing protein [Stagnimonas aquatica]|uniref:SH3 domain-containing protein n=1 Tax=Stagnimonas aquatica TaxID=2689987 RepID=A0A3N0VKI5_9GAMM|nr:SH3 domain-containing protein [Stagnimonas aquatica]ROH93282.1 SH3 domain-containing protein [Stagnimonas aquatica]